MSITLAIVNAEDYQPDVNGTVLLIDLGDKKHYYFHDEFTTRYTEAETQLSIISENKFIVQNAFFSSITNGNTGHVFRNGRSVKEFIIDFIEGRSKALTQMTPSQLLTPSMLLYAN